MLFQGSGKEPGELQMVRSLPLFLKVVLDNEPVFLGTKRDTLLPFLKRVMGVHAHTYMHLYSLEGENV